MTTILIERFGIGRKTIYEGLKALEKAMLVRVRREPRRNPVGIIWDWPDADGPSGGLVKRFLPEVIDS